MGAGFSGRREREREGCQTCRVDASVLCGLERGGFLDPYAEGGSETLLALCACVGEGQSRVAEVSESGATG